MSKIMSSFVSLTESREFYRQLFDNDGHMLDKRNLIGKKEPEHLPEPLPGYCSDCGSQLVYPLGIGVCPTCAIEPSQDPIPSANDLMEIEKREASRARREEIEIYYRERDEKDIQGNL